MPKHNVCIYNLVRSMGFEPIRDFSHHPLKVACLPFHHDREEITLNIKMVR